MRLDDSKTRIFFDMHLPSWPGKGIAERFDPERIADAFSRAGADSAILYAKCQYGNFYTKLDGESLHPGLGGEDFLEELALLLRERGIRSIAYYSVSWDERIADERPEWLTLSSSGARGAGPSTRWRTLCINGEYADMVERHVAAIARKPVDGLWLDMTIIGDGNCYCPRCREAFRKRFGAEPPTLRGDPRMGDFLAFRYDLVESFYRRIRDAARLAAPDLAFTNNYWGYPYSSTGMGSRAIGAATEADFVTGEAYSDWTGIRSTSFLPIFLRGVARGRPYEALIGRFINTWDYTKKPEAFLSYEAFAVFSQGATVTVDDQPYHDGRIDEELYGEDLARIFAELRGQAATVRGKPLRFAAIYHSQKTKDRAVDQSAFIRSVSGAFRLLRDLKLQVEFLFDESLDEEALEGFKLIVLPSVSELDEAEWRLLEAFAARGGLLLLSGSLGNSDGAEAAKRSLGLRGGSESPYTVSYLRIPEFSSRDLLVRGRYAQYSGGSGTGSAIVDPICETSPERFFHNNLPAPYRDSGLPGLVEAELGNGSIALFPQPIFSHYAKEPSRELREIVRELAFRRVGRPFVEIRAPLKIDFSIYEDGDVVYVHLLNPNAESSLCCGLMDTYDGAFERSYEYMEEIVPVSDLEIIVHARETASVEALRERAAIEVTAAPEGISIRVARLNIWEILRIELKGKRA